MLIIIVFKNVVWGGWGCICVTYSQHILLCVQLLGVVQESVSDVQGLHSKLDRKTNVEDSNLSTASRFQSHLHFDLDALQCSMADYSESQQQTCKRLSSNIGGGGTSVLYL